MADVVGWLKGKFGMVGPAPTYYGDAPRGSWPSDQEMAMARKYDQSYGSTAAGFVDPNATGVMRQYPSATAYIQAAKNSASGTPARGQEMDLAVLPAAQAARTGKGQPARAARPEQLMASEDPLGKYGMLKPIGPAQADRMNEAYVGAQRSALSALGFDPRRLAAAVPTGQGSVIAGRYRPRDDFMMVDGAEASTPVHEAFHRGFEMLRQSGRMPEIANLYVSNPTQEEYAVRALMLRNFGGIEREGNPDEVGMGENMLQQRMGREVLDAIERSAAEQIARDTPTGEYKRGPR